MFDEQCSMNKFWSAVAHWVNGDKWNGIKWWDREAIRQFDF